MLVVLAVIGIAATLAMPWFYDRMVRQQVKDALPLADIAKKPIAAAWGTLQDFPADNAAAGLPVPDKIVSNYVRSLEVADGAIHMTFGNQAGNGIAGKLLTLRPAVVADEPVVPVAWICGQAATPEKMTAHGANRTNIEPRYLPAECRGPGG